MRKQWTFGIKSPPFHHHTDAIDRQLFQPLTLFGLDLSCKPDKMFVLTELLFYFISANTQHRGQRSSGTGWAVERSRHTEYGRHFHVHGEDLAMSIGDRPSRSFQGHTLLMLPIRSGRELCCLQYLQCHKPKQNDAESAKKQEQ